jgi:hypothetical protein
MKRFGAFQIAPLTLAVFGFALPLLLFGLHAEHRLDADEGVVLFGAWSLLNGHQAYVDDFQFIAPASNYLLYGLWNLFGPHFWIAKSAAVFSIYLTSVAIYQTSKLVRPNALPTLGMFVGSFMYCLISGYWPAISHNTFNAAVMSWALYFTLKYILRRRFSDAIFSGLLTGLAVLFLQHKGMMLFLALAASCLWFLLKDKDARWLKGLALYCSFTFLPLLTLLNWPVALLYESLIEFPRLQYMAVNRTTPMPLIIAGGCLLLIFLAFQGQLNRVSRILFVVQGLMFGTTMHRPDLAHVLILTFPMLALLCVPLSRLIMRFEEAGVPHRIQKLAGKLAVTLILASGSIVCAIRWTEIGTTPENWVLLQEAKKNCRSIYAGPFLPSIYYELRLQNPTRFSYLITNFHTKDHFDKARAQLEQNRPECAVISYQNVRHFNYNIDNPVEDFISRNYELHLQSGDEKLLLLR